MITCNRGIAFHFHHDILAEWCSGYNRRVEEIKQFKPKMEQSLRLRVFRLIPNDRLPSKLKTAYEIYDKAEEAHIRAWEIYVKAQEARDKAGEARDKAEEARDKAWETCMPQLERLHGELCPDCPWNGQTIFTRQNDAGEWY